MLGGPLVQRIAGQPVGGAELGDLVAQQAFGVLQPLVLRAAARQADEELLDQRGDRGAALRGDDPGMAGGLVVQ